MAIPKQKGDEWESEIIPKDTWILVQQNVNNSTIRNAFGGNITVFFRYVKTGADAPTGLDVAKMSVSEDGICFEDSVSRDIYLYAVDFDAKVELEQ